MLEQDLRKRGPRRIVQRAALDSIIFTPPDRLSVELAPMGVSGRKPGASDNGVAERPGHHRADGLPLALAIAGANVPDAQLLAETIEAVVSEGPEPEPAFAQHVVLAKGYVCGAGWGACIDHGYEPHIAPIRDVRPPCTETTTR